MEERPPLRIRSRARTWALRFAKWLLIVVLGITGVFLLGTLIENIRGKRAWAAYVAEATARGELLTPASVIPLPLPDEENFAMAEIFHPLFDFVMEPNPDGPGFREPRWRNPQARDLVKAIQVGPPGKRPKTHGEWPTGHFVDLAAWQAFYAALEAFPKPKQPGSPAEDVLFALAKYDDTFSQLQAASSRRFSRFPVPYEELANVTYPHLVVLIQLAQISHLCGVAALAMGQPERAFRETALTIRLGNAVSDEPYLISLLIRLANLNLALTPIWEGLARHGWREEDLEAIEEVVAPINLVENAALALRGERALFAIPFLQKDYVRLSGVVSQSGFGRFSELPTWIIPSGWYDQDRVSLCHSYQAMLDCLDPASKRFDAQRVRQLQEEEAAAEGLDPYTEMIRQSSRQTPNILRKVAQTQAYMNLARVAVALERHHLRHAAYPSTLDEVDATALPAGGWPLDPATGTPVHYAPLPGDTFRIYYNGWNGQDDKGIIIKGKNSIFDLEEGDWVWPEVKL